MDFDRGWWFSATHYSPQLNHHVIGESNKDGSSAEQERIVSKLSWVFKRMRDPVRRHPSKRSLVFRIPPAESGQEENNRGCVHADRAPGEDARFAHRPREQHYGRLTMARERSRGHWSRMEIGDTLASHMPGLQALKRKELMPPPFQPIAFLYAVSATGSNPTAKPRLCFSYCRSPSRRSPYPPIHLAW